MMQDSLITEAIANCEHEPIHALGHIQAHGALLCFSREGRLLGRSENAEAWLGPLPDLGALVDERHFDITARAALLAAFDTPSRMAEGVVCDGPNGQRFDLVIHASADVLIAEWEQIPAESPSIGHYAALSQRAIQKLHEGGYESVDQLLQGAVEAVRSMTGFDRVMGYRFLQDDSGQVVAEDKRDDLSPFLNQRYPAADIPPQARRLYVLHPIRQIVSVNAVPVPIHPVMRADTGQPFDLSHAMLRSVSPIHIEYLKNMGVAASMSISIVIGGRLWGLIACHHSTAFRTSLAVRLSCTVLTQVLAILIESAEFKRRVSGEARRQALGREIAIRMAGATDFPSGLVAAREALEQMVDCDGVSVVVDQLVLLDGTADARGLLELADHMHVENQDLLAIRSLSRELPEMVRPLTNSGTAAGLLAVQINSEARITVVWLRDELVETIRWAGPPGKVIASGPNGARLTPRGSFEVWKQTVTGSSREWDALDIDGARAVKGLLLDVSIERLRETDRERMTLLATLGHDLRDPLQAINLAMQMMGRGLASSGDTARRVEGSTRRMQSLISYIMDVSRIRAGIGLGLVLKPVLLDDVLTALVDELRFNYSSIVVTFESVPLGVVEMDEDRFIQGMTNLLSNARQHGDISAPIRIVGRREGNSRVIEVCNRTRRRPAAAFSRLIDPFKGGQPNLNNRHGLGLGLYIANAIFRGHGARFDGQFEEHDVCFRITFDLADIAGQTGTPEVSTSATRPGVETVC